MKRAKRMAKCRPHAPVLHRDAMYCFLSMVADLLPRHPVRLEELAVQNRRAQGGPNECRDAPSRGSRDSWNNTQRAAAKP